MISPANHSQKSPLIRIPLPRPSRKTRCVKGVDEISGFHSARPEWDQFRGPRRRLQNCLGSRRCRHEHSALRPLLSSQQVAGRVDDATRRQCWTARSGQFRAVFPRSDGETNQFLAIPSFAGARCAQEIVRSAVNEWARHPSVSPPGELVPMRWISVTHRMAVSVCQMGRKYGTGNTEHTGRDTGRLLETSSRRRHQSHGMGPAVLRTSILYVDSEKESTTHNSRVTGPMRVHCRRRRC